MNYEHHLPIRYFCEVVGVRRRRDRWYFNNFDRMQCDCRDETAAAVAVITNAINVCANPRRGDRVCSVRDAMHAII